MPDSQRIEGTVTFVQYEKKFISIEYEVNKKKKTINGSIKDDVQLKLKAEKLIPDLHRFREGDQVTFEIIRSQRGDKNVADRIIFRYNNALSNIIHKAKTENEFTGYLKIVDDQYFIKEIGSYHFFPLKIGAWELHPPVDTVNDPIYFKLDNIENPDKVKAVLLDQKFIPGYRDAMKAFLDKRPVEAEVVKISPHAIYVELKPMSMQAKLLVKKGEPITNKVGDEFKVHITFLGPDKIAIKKI